MIPHTYITGSRKRVAKITELLLMKAERNAQNRVDYKPLETISVPCADVHVRNSGEVDGAAREFTSSKVLYGVGDNFDCLA